MPITVTVPQPLDHIGPGINISFTSDFIGPLEAGSKWRIKFDTDPEFVTPTVITTQPASTVSDSYELFGVHSSSVLESRVGGREIANGATAHVQVELLSPANAVLDSGVETKQWDTVSLLPQFVREYFQLTTGKGLSSAQASQLTEIQNSVHAQITTATGDITLQLGQLFSRQTLDRLTLLEITDGETFDPVSADVASYFFGVIVRVTTIPDAYAPRLIDNDWRYPDLAVLRVFRGADLEYRRGIHTSSWLASSPWGYNLQILNLAFFDTPPPETTVRVDWALGCGGRVFLMAWP